MILQGCHDANRSSRNLCIASLLDGFCLCAVPGLLFTRFAVDIVDAKTPRRALPMLIIT